MNNMDNLQSYDNVEFIQANEMSGKELQRYCDLKMETAQDNVKFIKQYFTGGGDREAFDVCEIGGGNGKLLYALEKEGILNKGINYEVSKNRCDLATKFAKILSCHKVKNINCNFLEDNTVKNEFDCIIMVDIVLQLISPLYDAAEKDMIRWIKNALKKGGYLYAEIIDYSDIMREIKKEGVMRRWEEFAEADPFQYSLQKLSIDKDNNMINEKYFIRRNNNKRECFKNVIRSYTQKEIVSILEKNDFCVSVYPYYDNEEMFGKSAFRILAKNKV